MSGTVGEACIDVAVSLAEREVPQHSVIIWGVFFFLSSGVFMR